MELATFSAGCFWGVEAKFRKVLGVISTRVGYTGGHTQNPNYEAICSGQTGHAEAIEIVFDPEIVSFEQLLDVFWKIHDPTTLNRQGPDIGTQYRSAVFYHDTKQKELALDKKKQLNETTFNHSPIITEVSAVSTFFPAEEYHQCFLDKRQ